MIGLNTDITEHHNLEGYFKNIVRLASDMLVVATARGGFLHVSPSCEKILGYTTEEILKLDWTTLIHPDDMEPTNIKVAEQLQGKMTAEFVNRYRHKDGSYRTLEWMATFAADGHVYAAARDITERKKAEAVLAESENHRRSILAAAPVGVGVVLNRVFKTVNEQVCSMTGYREDELIGQSSRIVYPSDEEWAHVGNSKYEQIRMKGVGYVETRWQCKDGRILDVFLSAAPLDTLDLGKGVTFTAMDITDRKKAESELKTKSAELERFLYTASHDLKTPVVTIQSFISHLKDDLVEGDTDRIEKDLRFIGSSADKMVHLLDDLLEMSRVGRLIGASSHVTVKELVADVVNTVAGRIADSGVDVQVADMDVSLYGDRPRLAEIWQNLIENACKFMGDQKSPRIDIGMEQRDKDTVFYVRDNGIGIEPRHHDRVFDLFERLDKKVEGTGMGLAIVKRIVELCKGRIWVESEGAGQGTSFCFTLPGAMTEGIELSKRVRFAIKGEPNREVYVTGTLNDWNPKKDKLVFKDGIYSASIHLEPGRYEYKFIIDGIWCVDPECSERAPNGQGSLNSVIVVK